MILCDYPKCPAPKKKQTTVVSFKGQKFHVDCFIKKIEEERCEKTPTDSTGSSPSSS